MRKNTDQKNSEYGHFLRSDHEELTDTADSARLTVIFHAQAMDLKLHHRLSITSESTNQVLFTAEYIE